MSKRKRWTAGAAAAKKAEGPKAGFTAPMKRKVTLEVDVVESDLMVMKQAIAEGHYKDKSTGMYLGVGGVAVNGLSSAGTLILTYDKQTSLVDLMELHRRWLAAVTGEDVPEANTGG